MQLKPVIFFSVVALLAGSFVYREVTREGNPGVINVGQQAPDFTIKDADGQEVSLGDFRGKLVFLNFWATWCAPCIDEMPEMELMHKTFQKRNFQMLAISLDTDWKPVKQFYEEYKLSFPTLLDPGRQVADLYKVFKYPETFIIDENGYVVRHVVGPERWANPRVMATVELLIPEADTQALR